MEDCCPYPVGIGPKVYILCMFVLCQFSYFFFFLLVYQLWWLYLWPVLNNWQGIISCVAQVLSCADVENMLTTTQSRGSKIGQFMLLTCCLHTVHWVYNYYLDASHGEACSMHPVTESSSYLRARLLSVEYSRNIFIQCHYL